MNRFLVCAWPRLRWSSLRTVCTLLAVMAATCSFTRGQTPAAETASAARMDRLMQALERTQTQLEASQWELQALRHELAEMRADLAAGKPLVSAGATAAESSSAAEQASFEANAIATLDQVKVESESHYPLRLSGTLLLNGFVNSGGVDQPASPSSALGGPGNVGLSVQQTVLGLDASGPHLLGAASHADVRVDFFGTGAGQGYAGAGGLLRLRTAHAALDWKHTQLFFAQDRTLLNPNAPESLVAVAHPELAWSGNLWSWNPQVGVTHTFGDRTRLRLQAAVIDPADSQPGLLATNAAASATAGAVTAPNLSEASRRPGAEARVAVLGSDEGQSAQLGVGGYFAPHFVATNGFGDGVGFNAWAGTLDFRLPLGHGLRLSGSAYRGQALGGLGGGGYKDYVARSTPTGMAVRPLEDVGGWAQLHQTLGQRFAWNAGFGLDNAFASQVSAAFLGSGASPYGDIARNRTVFANVIYSPSAYLLLSVEYRNLYTAPAPGRLWISNTTGVGAAYRF